MMSTRHSPPVSGLINDEESLMFGAYYGFTSGKTKLDFGKNYKVTQIYFFRKVPKYLGSYILSAGLETLMAHIEYCMLYGINKFQKSWLKETSGGDMSEEFLNYLENFNPKFNIWAVPEGTPMFPNEPVLMIEANYIDIQIIEDALLTILNHQSLIATKASRMRYACGDRALADFGARRAHGMGAGLLGARAGYIGGTDATSLVLAGYKFGIPYLGTMPHAFMQTEQRPNASFRETELEAFRDYTATYPHNSLLLVDTYNSYYGIKNAITVAKELELKGYGLKGIRLDSGNLGDLAKMAREMLIDAGLYDVKIYASDNIDEYEIIKLLRDDAPIDGFGVGTRLQTGANIKGELGGTSTLGGVLKICEVNGQPSMKFTDAINKSTNPTKQQVIRVLDSKRQRYQYDVLNTVGYDEDMGKALLVPIMKEGELVYDFPPLKEVRQYALNELSMFKKGVRDILSPTNYSVITGIELGNARRKLKEKYKEEFERKRG